MSTPANSTSVNSTPANSAPGQSTPDSDSLEIFVQCLKKVPDPRSKRGKSHPFPTVLAIVLLGLLGLPGNISTLAEIHRWAKIHLPQLQQFLKFRHRKGKTLVPHDTTLARILEKLPLDDLQKAFATFLNAILPESSLVAAVDGKTAK